jgi:hypothetical protein
MVCHENGDDRKLACTWCQLRICKGCTEELRMIPGMDLGALLRARGEMLGKEEMNPGIVVEDVDGDEVEKVGEEHVVEANGYEDTLKA